MTVTAQCVNVNDLILRVEATSTIGEWREIIRKLNGSQVTFYGPLNDLLSGVKNSINEIMDRSAVQGVDR